MSKIEIQEGKRLKLVNVVVNSLDQIQPAELDYEINKMLTNINALDIKIKGPLITYFKGTRVSDSGEIFLDYDILLQTEELTEINGYQIKQNYKTEQCLYTHFSGEAEAFHFAQEKLGIYAWENDVITTGEEYIIYIENDGLYLTADIFRPLV